MHLLKLHVGPWVFAPTWWPSLAMVFFLVLTLWLGNWQSGRAETKRALQAQYDAAVQAPAIHVGHDLLDSGSVLHRRLEVQGEFDDANTILLDNRVHGGVAGYHVLTPLRIAGSTRAILVNRGWIAVGPTRAQLPSTQAPTGLVKLEGMAVDPVTRYLELSNRAPSGPVWQNLDFARYATRSGLSLQPVLLLQSSEQDDGLIRDWPRPDSGVSMHVSYAFQWYSLAATLVVLWLVLNVRRHVENDA